jgi:hypothetical protein
MATRTKIQGAPGLSFIYNVSQRVGPGKDNLPDDVELVQFLMGELTKSSLKHNIKLRINSPPPPLSRSFDLATGFWIFEFQFAVLTAQPRSVTLDGFVTPARGVGYGENKVWTIVVLNELFRESRPAEFATLHLNPRLSPSLRNAIRPL